MKLTLKRKTYQTRRLVLRPYRETDFSTWRDVLSTALPKKTPQDWEAPPGQKFTRQVFAQIKRRQEKAVDKGHFVWPIFIEKHNQFIGFVDVTVLIRDSIQVANLGYRIDNRYWRKGFAKEAVSAMIKNALVDLKLNRLEAVIDLDNKASIGLARAVGMKREGIRRHYFYQNGKWEDQVIFIATRANFGLPPLKLD